MCTTSCTLDRGADAVGGADLEHIERRGEELDKVIAPRCQLSDDAVLLISIPSAAAFTTVSMPCRVGRFECFFRFRSLANYWGLCGEFSRTTIFLSPACFTTA